MLLGAANLQIVQCFLHLEVLEDCAVACTCLYIRPRMRRNFTSTAWRFLPSLAVASTSDFFVRDVERAFLTELIPACPVLSRAFEMLHGAKKVLDQVRRHGCLHDFTQLVFCP